MTVLISDAAALIDLERAGIVDAMLKLPHAFAMLDALYTTEVEPDAGVRWQSLGLRIETMDEAELSHAVLTRRTSRQLSLTDCCALALGTSRGWRLLAGGTLLGHHARASGLVYGSLVWLFDEIAAAGGLDRADLCACMEAIISRPRCPVVTAEMASRIALHQRQE